MLSVRFSLGINGCSTSTINQNGAMKNNVIPTDSFRILAYSRQHAVREILYDNSVGVRSCSIARQFGSNHVTVIDNGALKHRYGQLQHCKNNWACPLCSLSISGRRRKLLSEAIKNERQQGHGVVMVTYTMQHDASMSLAQSIDLMNKAHAWFHSNRAWTLRARRCGWLGSVKTCEVTWRKGSGWHWHIHEIGILQTDDQKTIKTYRKFKGWKKNWRAALRKFGGDCTLRRGLTVQSAYGSVDEYVGKWGLVPEIVSSGLKSGRIGGVVPFQILDNYVSSEQSQRTQWRNLYKEYFISTSGIHQFHPSKQLRHYFEDKKQVDDFAEMPLEPLVYLNTEQWFFIWSNKLRAQLINAANKGFLAKWLGDNLPSNLTSV